MPVIPLPDYRHLFDQLPGACLVLLPDLTIAAANEAYIKANPSITQVLTGTSYFDIPTGIEEPYGSAMQHSFNIVLQSGLPHEIPLKQYITCPPGAKSESCWRTVKNNPVFDESGQLRYIIHSFTDMPTGTQPADLLENKVQEFDLLIAGIDDYAIFLLDHTGTVASWNAGAEKMKGYASEEIIGKPLDIFYTDEDIHKGIPMNNLAKALQHKRYETEGWRLRKDGSRFYAHITFHALNDASGRHYGYAKVTRDITARKEGEKQTRFLGDITKNIQDPVICSDNDFVITRWNEAAERVFEWPAEEAIGHTTMDILQSHFSPGDREAVINTLHKHGYWHGEVIYHTKSGRPVNGLCTVSHLKDAQGKIYGNLILIKDITRRKNAELALEKLNAELERRVEERTREIVQTEQKYYLLFDNNPLPMWVISLDDFRFLDVNRMATIQYGYSREEFLSMTAFDIRPDEERESFRKIDHLGDTDATNYNKGIWRHKKKDGSIIEVQVISHEIMFEGERAKLVLANDVTERRKAEQQLADSEKRHRTTLNSMIEGVHIFDFDWKFVYANDALVKTSRFTREQLMGATFMELYPGVEKTELYSIMQRCMVSRVTEQLETEFVFPDGSVSYYQLNIQPVPEGIFILSIDITERKKAQQQLVESEENLKAIFDNASEGFILTDIQGNIRIFNQRVRESILLNVSSEIEMGGNVFDLVEPDRIGFFKDVFAKVTAGQTIEYDREYLTEDGRHIWINLEFNPVYKNKLIDGICITGRDITDRKKAEEQLHKSFVEKRALAERTAAILNTLPANIALVDPGGKIIEVNEVWRDFAIENGFDGKDFGIGENYITLSNNATAIDEPDRIKLAAGLSSVLQDQEHEFIHEYPTSTPRKKCWYRMVVTPLQKKAYAGAVVMHLDISELRRLEAERIRHRVEEQHKITQAILHGQEKERNHIAREMHDNINQILAGARMYLSLAASKSELIEENVRYPIELLDHTVEEIRMLCSNMVTPLQDVQLEELLHDLLRKLGKNTGIDTKIDYQVPAGRLSDELKLNIYRIVQELSNNIIKYAQASLVTIEIGITNDQLSLVMTDNGKGFDVKGKKSGIGLSNIRSRVESFDGEVEVESSEGNGTRTSILIPV